MNYVLNCFNLFFIPFLTPCTYKKAIKNKSKLIKKIIKAINIIRNHLDASKTLSLMFSDSYTIPQVPLWLTTTELRYIVTPTAQYKLPEVKRKPGDEQKWCIIIIWFVWTTSNSWKWYGYHLVGPEQTTLVHNNTWLN